MTGTKFESEGRITSCIQKWLDRYWRRGKIPAKAKASLCNGLLTALHGNADCDGRVFELTANFHERIEEIRHVKSNCTTRFVRELTPFVGDLNTALRALGQDAPQVRIPLHDGNDGNVTKQSVSIPDEYVRENRTLVPACDVTPVEIDAKGLGETVVRIVILDGKVTCDITQKRK